MPELRLFPSRPRFLSSEEPSLVAPTKTFVIDKAASASVGRLPLLPEPFGDSRD